jgi:sulfite reductase (ferredoxin)
VGVHPQQDGQVYVGVAPTVGRVSGTLLVKLADLMEQYAVAGARLTPYQKIVLIGIDRVVLDDLLPELDAIGLSARPSNWRQNTMACTGIEFCKLAIVETKARARDLVEELERRFPDLDVPITVNVNGCPNACARTQVADIGLKGQLVMDADRNQVEGFQVHLGGGLGLDSGFGRKLRSHKVTTAELGDYVERLVRGYVAQHQPGERFAQWVARADESVLR